jgi:trehalose 6-phosphate phosphatase
VTIRPHTAAGEAGLAAVVADPRRAVVAVDFDGTLAPIVENPHDARPAAGAIEALSALAGRLAACSVVTGRPAAEAVALGGLDRVPGLVVLGHYGLQEWRDGRVESPTPVPAIEQARVRIEEVLAAAADGVHLEDKEHSLAVHTRPAADPAAALAAVTPALESLADSLGLELVPGRYVVELRPPGTDKGLAVRRLVEQTDATVIVYIGDDLGDLPAFAAIEQLRTSGGCDGLLVASLGDDAPEDLAAAADLTVDGPDGVIALLRELAIALR